MAKKGRARGWPKWTDVALVVGAVAVLALSGWAVVRSPEPVTTSRTTSYTPAPTESPSPEPTTLAAARAALADSGPVVVSVLGDSTGNDPIDWVPVWATMLASERAVTLHGWDDARGRWAAPQRLSASGPALHIWNASSPGRAAGYVVDRIKRMQPEKPDLVIYNFGHNNTADTIDVELYYADQAVIGLWGARPASVLVAQNPSTTALAERQVETATKVRDVVGPFLGMPVVDVLSAFRDAPGPVDRLLADGTHPNAAGGRLWAETVAAALG